MQHWRAGKFDPCLLAQFASQRLLSSLSDVYSASGKMPAPHVGVSDEKHAIVFVYNSTSHADGEGMEEAAVDCVQACDQASCIGHDLPQHLCLTRRPPQDTVSRVL